MTLEKTRQKQKQTIRATMSYEQIEIAKRLHKGNQIFQSGLVKWIRGDYYEVRSQSNPNMIYGVDAINKLCDCEDFIRHNPNLCKHLYAVNFFRMDKIKQSLVGAQVKAVSKITTAAGIVVQQEGKRKLKIGIVQ